MVKNIFLLPQRRFCVPICRNRWEGKLSNNKKNFRINVISKYCISIVILLLRFSPREHSNLASFTHLSFMLRNTGVFTLTRLTAACDFSEVSYKHVRIVPGTGTVSNRNRRGTHKSGTFLLSFHFIPQEVHLWYGNHSDLTITWSGSLLFFLNYKTSTKGGAVIFTVVCFILSFTLITFLCIFRCFAAEKMQPR